MRRGFGALFVAVLAVRIFLGPVATPSQSPTSPLQTKTSLPPAAAASRSTNADTTRNRLAASHDACDTSCLGSPGKGLVDAVKASLGTPTQKSDLTNRWDVSKENAKNAHFLIATVPDPVHTHLTLFFDRQIVAIEEAVQQGGYLFSRAYLPWDNVQHSENPDFHARTEEQHYVDAREDYPGVLVFHNAGGPTSTTTGPRPLLVFLVAETPTAGINKEQFSNAIGAIREICRTGCAEPQSFGNDGKIFILGPTFSGSLYSLHSILMGLRRVEGFSAVTIHSGTATSNGTIQWFLSRTKDFSGTDISFRTFEEGSGYALEHLLDFVCGAGYRADRMAVLSEDETAYGKVVSASEDGAPSNGETCPNDSKKGRILHLYFPRDVSQLRNAYQQDAAVSGTSSNMGAPRSTLRLNLEDTGNDDDSVPSFSQGQTPLSQEATMMGIVSDLREHEVNLVVLEATNPLDIVFLVRYLRVAYPDARIVTISTDLLLPRQVDDPRLRGTMQVTSYSLIPEIDEYTTVGACGQDAHLNRIFPSDYSTGTFNAALSLMQVQRSAINACRGSSPQANPPQNGLGQVSDLIPAAYAEYGWPTLAGEAGPGKTVLVPPLWLTMLGRDQFWPVDLLDGADTHIAPGGTPSLLHAIASGENEQSLYHFLPAPWIVVCLLGAAFGLVYALLALNGNIMSASIFLANFAPVEDRCRNGILLLCGVVIFEIFFCLLWPIPWYSGYTKWVALILPCAGVLIVWDLWRRGRWRLVSPLLLLGGVSFAILCWAFGVGSGPLENFMRYRYVHVTSGVSPAVPFLLLFAACLWACWHSLSGRPPWDQTGKGPPLPSRSKVIDERNPEGPAANQRLTALTDEGNVDLLKLMRPCGLGRRVAILTSIALAIPLLAVIVPSSPHTIQSFEGRRYDMTYTVLVVLAVALVLWETFRLSFLWIELRRLSLALDRLPLRRGFARMAGFKSRRLWQLGGNTYEDFFTVLSREIQTINALANARPRGEGIWEPLKTAQDAVKAFSEWIRQERGLADARAVEFTNLLVQRLWGLQETLAGTCATVLQGLNHEWNLEKRPAWEAECIVREKSECKDSELPLPVRLAEDFVCLFYFNFISSVFTRMRALVLTIAGLYVFILLSFSSYPFEPSSTFHTAMIFLLVFIAVAVGIVYGQAHKDATISRITDTEVGKLGVEFWFRLAAFVAVPLLTLLAARFPEIGGFLFSWLEPASQAFR